MDNKVKIILAGAAGRMGKAIAELIAEEPEFVLAGVVESSDKLRNLAGWDCAVSVDLANIISQAQDAVIVDFTSAAAALANARVAANLGAPMVIGTTGFGRAEKDELAKLAQSTPLLLSANMSVGITALLEFLPQLAKALGENYDFEIMEIHHRHKKDAPSGTALMLGDALAKARDLSLDETRRSSRDGMIGERTKREIGVQALRGGDVVGIHTCYFLGTGEIIEISHQAESRVNFAQGALRAASWLVTQKPGRLYSMKDVLGL